MYSQCGIDTGWQVQQIQNPILQFGQWRDMGIPLFPDAHQIEKNVLEGTEHGFGGRTFDRLLRVASI